MFEPLPSLIRAERERQQLSQLALANLAGLSRTSIIAVESGEDNISLGVLLKVAKALKMTRLHIGDLSVDPGTPDLTVLLVAREALAAAERVTDQAAASREELLKHSKAVSQLLHRASDPAHLPDVGIGKAAQRLASRPDQRSTARALRDLAESGDAIPRSSARPKPAAKTAPRRQGR